jgi:hypothetical protein
MTKLPPFLPGLDLNRLFFQQVIKPLLDEHFPILRYSAGIMGEGSDVLRFDTPRSMDHNWGPHMQIFLTERDYRSQRDAIDKMFREKLPYEFMGFPTNYTEPAETYLVQQMKPIKSGPVNHMIHFFTIKSFFKHYLGFDPYRRIAVKDWLAFPQQALLEVTSGEVFYDGLEELESIRQKFAYYPDDVWRYIYMTQWGYIGNEEAFMGRSGEVGDELGSNIIATNLVNHIMRLCFLIEKRYIPYIKWYGTGFSRLKCASELSHILLSVVHGQNWGERETHLSRAYEIIAEMHNRLKLTPPIKAVSTEFEGRPYKVLHAMEVYNELAKVVKPSLLNLKYKVGAIDQFIGHQKINHMEYIYNEFKTFLGKHVRAARE